MKAELAVRAGSSSEDRIRLPADFGGGLWSHPAEERAHQDRPAEDAGRCR